MRFLTTIVAAAGLAIVLALAGGCEKKDESKVTVALTGQYPPFSMYNDEGELVGFDVDVSRAIAGEMGKEADIITTAWDGILPGLMADKYDLIIGSMAVTPQRQNAVNFSEPYYRSGAQLFVAKQYADEIKSIEDIGDRAVGVNQGETYQDFLEQNHPDVTIKTYQGVPSIFADIENGRIVGFVSDRLVGMYQINQAGAELVPVGDMLYAETMAIPVKKDRPELLDQVNAALAALKESGELDRIHTKWFGDIERE
jgi:ABC-type amino acid transport substrate-binding protein